MLALTVAMKPEEEGYLDADGFRMTDRLRDKVARFCKMNGIPDSDEFVCIAVHDDCDTPSSYLHGYGDIEIRLKHTLIDELSVVCDGDFQTVAANGYDKVTTNSQADYAKRFHDLSVLSAEKKRAKLEQLIERSRDVYVEVRLFRPITRADIETRTDHSLFGNLKKASNKKNAAYG